jgi:hypothetical protein
VIEHPASQRDGRVAQTVERLRAVRHLDGVGEMMRKKIGELFVCAQLVPGEPGLVARVRLGLGQDAR